MKRQSFFPSFFGISFCTSKCSTRGWHCYLRILNFVLQYLSFVRQGICRADIYHCLHFLKIGKSNIAKKYQHTFYTEIDSVTYISPIEPLPLYIACSRNPAKRWLTIWDRIFYVTLLPKIVQLQKHTSHYQLSSTQKYAKVQQSLLCIRMSWWKLCGRCMTSPSPTFTRWGSSTVVQFIANGKKLGMSILQNILSLQWGIVLHISPIDPVPISFGLTQLIADPNLILSWYQYQNHQTSLAFHSPSLPFLTNREGSWIWYKVSGSDQYHPVCGWSCTVYAYL